MAKTAFIDLSNGKIRVDQIHRLDRYYSLRQWDSQGKPIQGGIETSKLA